MRVMRRITQSNSLRGRLLEMACHLDMDASSSRTSHICVGNPGFFLRSSCPLVGLTKGPYIGIILYFLLLEQILGMVQE